MTLVVACFQVADTLVEAFPEEEDSVRVALREKYNSLLQRLGHCTVLGMNTGWLHLLICITFLEGDKA